MQISRQQIDVSGTVQGVGFRPFVYRIATNLDLVGSVCNTSAGVSIDIQGPAERVEAFCSALTNDAPPLARIQSTNFSDLPVQEIKEFTIRHSEPSNSSSAQISPDIAPCDECLAEMFSKSDRRFSYPFINCTNCGPRFTIIESVPYDRPATTMKSFEMCDKCASEYDAPLDRRFHAQPNACEICGPGLSFVNSDKSKTIKSGKPIELALKELRDGGIVAIKGAGGFHLACDATNASALAKLRERKMRDKKPFAVMVGNIQEARKLCHISETEERLLASPERPIVLLKKLDRCELPRSVAPGNKYLGLMLPSTPLHHLLFSDSQVFVMTSGNLSDEPLAYRDEEAMERLQNIADAFLLHDREINIRIDDSIARDMAGRPVLMRRARGYVPEPIHLNFDMPKILATGADMKGAICLTKGANALLSQHLGNLENAEACESFESAVSHLSKLYDIEPDIITCDLHPDYFSSRYAESKAKSHSVNIIRVQHHHAHIAACMAENDLPNENIIGIALDGTGLGTDDTIWGGEVLVANYEKFTRAAYFSPAPLPGGDMAAREPWRMALAYLTKSCDREIVDTWARTIPVDMEKVKLVSEMIDKDINSPMTSSCGRLFDAVAALIGLRLVNSFEGQAAMELEQIADIDESGYYDFSIEGSEINFSLTIKEILADLYMEIPTSTISGKFHNTIVEALRKSCRAILDDPQFTIDDSKVCLSGGCFQNLLLTSKLKKILENEGFTVYTHSLVPPNDGGIALGQAAIAAHISNRA
jgi:hydrogenase maturation protein HypF